MKKFLSEYGFAILAAIVVILLIMMIGPISNSIQNKIEIIVTSFANKTSIKLGSVENGVSEGEQHKVVAGMPKKSDLITIEGAQYRVLDVNGTQTKLLAMNDTIKIAFNDCPTAVYRTDDQKYKGSKLDNYLENTWFTGLSQAMKDAIIAQNIEQNMFTWNGTPVTLSSWYKDSFTESDTSGINYTLSKTGSISVGSRHVFALDIQDVVDYLGDSFTPQDLNEMFFNQPSTIDESIWLRSFFVDNFGYAFYVCGYNGLVNYDYYNWDYLTARPAFVIDLSKISFE